MLINFKRRKTICNGCLTYNHACVSNHIKNNIACPCSKCIIKVMCKIVCIEKVDFYTMEETRFSNIMNKWRIHYAYHKKE